MTSTTDSPSLRGAAAAAAWLLFVALTAVTGVFFFRAWQDYQTLRVQEQTTERRLAHAAESLKRQETVLQRLRTDPAYVEHVIRTKLGYARPGESVFRFEE